MDPIRVLLADMSPIARIAVRQSLSACAQVDIVADAAIAGMELLVHVRRATPDLVLIGVDQDGLGAVGGYRELSQYTNLGGSLTVFALPDR